jgi:catechol 2,3-dioxygenase-like lactoylglutathione lyase family enzyme
MEAANLGAWFAPALDADLDAALELLDAVPSYEHDPVAYVDLGCTVRERWLVGGDSLGAAQNTNTLYDVRSPMVFLGRDFHEREEPELVLAVRRQAERFGWSGLTTVVDDVDDAVAFVLAHDPDGAVDDEGDTLARGRRRPDRP